VTLSDTDRLDILELLARADNAASRRDAATYISYFTEDAILEGAKGEHRGRNALAEAVGPIWGSEGTATAHLTLNAVIDPVDGQPDRATATSTLVIVGPTSTGGTTSTVGTASTGGTASTIAIRSTSTIVQQVVRIGQTWQIARRSVSDG
jgi:ketosteroid isomerase-like protein